jgi:hypothetical protein
VIGPDGAVADFQTPLALRFPQACWMQSAARFVSPAPGQEARQAETAIRIYFRRRRIP